MITWGTKPRQDGRCKGPAAFLYFCPITFQIDKGRTCPQTRDSAKEPPAVPSGERPEGKRVDGGELDERQGLLLSAFLAGPTQILARRMLHTESGAWRLGPGRRWCSSLACRHCPGREEGRIGFVIRRSLDLNPCSPFITQIKVFDLSKPQFPHL